MMKILQINITSARNKKPQLAQILHEEDIHIACLSETFLKPKDKYQISDYNIIRKDRPSASYGGGVAILLKKDISFNVLPIRLSNEKIEIIACTINSQMAKITIVSLYIPPTINFNTADLDNILKNIPTDSRILCCGDFNAHHFSWGCNATDLKGITLLEWIERHDLVLLNNGSRTFMGCVNPSALDLSICSPSLALVSEWMVLNETLGSTHCAILIKLQLRPELRSKICFGVPKHIPDHILNDKVSEILNSENFLNADDGEKFDKFSEMFYDNFKTKISRKSYPDSPWWNVN